ncbi:MAG: tetratricopeptide repeat protein, partial [Anaerolineales bacterium]|nr:tetratricopeptide repeat protein [Anaerolineales bacterium]
MQLKGEQLQFGRNRRLKYGRIAVLLGLIVAGAVLLWMVETSRIDPPFVPAPTPTRSAVSFAQEGEAHFSSGNLPEAITALQNAVRLSPDDGQLQAELARIQTYASELQPSLQQRRELLAQARETIDQAIQVAPEDPFAHAVRALTFDWSASAEGGGELREAYLAEAETSAVRALQLAGDDPVLHSLAQAFYAEVIVDQQRFVEAADLAAQAAAQAPNSMDVHRVYGTVLEANGLYRQAIEEYQRATEITPNLTFLYLRIGANYRRLRDIERALEAFDQAARINTQVEIQNPGPFIAIGRTYMQDGEFFVAARNVERALAIDEGNPEIYGFLGIIYYKARNYESALDVLRCAVDGCSQEDSRRMLCQFALGCDPDDPQDAVAPLHGREVAGLPLGPSSLEY